jgi:hypothetical protein
VVGNIATIWSSGVRRSEEERLFHASTALGDVRAMRPEALIMMVQGSSSICKPAEAADDPAAPAPDNAESVPLTLAESFVEELSEAGP